MASKIVDGRRVLVGSKADPKSAIYEPKPITPQSLTDNPVPIKVPTPGPASAGASLGASFEAGADAFTKSLEARTTATAAGAGRSFDDLIAAIESSFGKGQLTDTAYSQKGGVDQLQGELNDINSRILQEQEAQRRTEERINENALGLETDALNGEIQRSRSESLSRQADLAVIQMAKQGQYDSAKAIADRAVAAKLEQQTQRNDLLKFIYQENKDLFTKAEQREFEAKQKDRDNKLAMERDKEMLRYQQLIKESDPLYQAQLAAAEAELGTGADISNSAFVQQPAYAKLTAKQKTQADSLNNLVRSLNEYRAAVGATDGVFGGATGINLFGADSAKLEAMYNSIIFAAAQAEGTGALQAADREVIEKIISNPTSLGGALNAATKGGKTGQLVKIDDQISKYTNNLSGYGLVPVFPDPSQVSDPLGLGLEEEELASNPLGI